MNDYIILPFVYTLRQSLHRRFVMSNTSLFLATAIEAVLRAGEIQLSYFGRDVRIEKKGVIDLVTEADLAVEEMFRDLINSRFPDHLVLAEEHHQTDSTIDKPGFRWIFDPIDGTTNFAHNLPIFCSSLALEISGRLEIATVYDPTRRELFTAERGGGAFLNGIPMKVSLAEKLVDSVLCTGFPYDVHDTLDDVVSLFSQFTGQARAVRRLGSAALDLCYVASGRLDGFWEQRLQAWDIAAGALLVEEAGGKISALSGGKFNVHAGEVLASNGLIHDAMMTVIKTHAQALD